MNCWEALLYGASPAGIIPPATLREMHAGAARSGVLERKLKRRRAGASLRENKGRGEGEGAYLDYLAEQMGY